jgi:hypothetical protein
MDAPESQEPIKLYFSYAREDQRLAFELKEYLSRYNFQLYEAEEQFIQNKSYDAQLSGIFESVDGFLFLITRNSFNTGALQSDLEQAISLASANSKFLIPLLSDELPVPQIISHIQAIRIKSNEELPKIAETIHSSVMQWKQSKLGNSEGSSPTGQATSKTSKRGGSRNAITLEIQKTLSELGFFDGFMDGIEGPQTKAAIRNFQTKNDLSPSGIWDEETDARANLWANDILANKEQAAQVKASMENEKNTATNIEKEKVERTAIEDEGDKYTLSQVFADSTVREIKDQLDFEVDVNALASVIAYREVKPPLAIGLFGNWGSGKSFFMNKLQERIEILQGDENNVFCKKILQINFNSWHYSDANLWASLITKIFDDLHNFGKEKPDNLSALLKNLNSTKELINDTKVEKRRLEDEISVLHEQKEIFDKTVEKSSLDLMPLNFEEILKAVMENSSVKEDLQKLKKVHDAEEIGNIEKIDENIDKLETVQGRLIESIKILYSFRSGKSWMVVLTAVLVAVGVFLLIRYSEIGQRYLEAYNVWITALGTLLSQVLIFIGPYAKKLESILNRLTSLKETTDNLKEKAREKYQDQKDELLRKINDAQSQSDSIQQKIELLTIEKNKLEREIEDISSGRKILRFIEGRVVDERYISNLGIISWIRKDFEQLDSLLRQQSELQKLTADEQKQIREFELDRIILYIDDLDRCSEEIVVKVLEAIHLLLAFPLFVVIVGVDPRWMHRALNVHYSKLLSGTEINATEDVQSNGGTGHPATSYDYLEKIFQIPFALKPMAETGIKNLIKSQFEIKPEIKMPEKPLESKPKELTADSTPNDLEIKTDNFVQPENFVKAEQKPELKPEIDEISKPKPPVIKTETLIISDEEIRFIQEASSIFGDSPRTVKRYTNIYRIIRTHSNFYTSQKDALLYYKAAIIMLAIITGQADIAKDILNLIREADESDSFEDFLNERLKKGIKIELKGQQLYSFLLQLTTSKEFRKKPLLIGHFKKNMNLVSRFSFRYI